MLPESHSHKLFPLKHSTVFLNSVVNGSENEVAGNASFNFNCVERCVWCSHDTPLMVISSRSIQSWEGDIGFVEFAEMIPSRAVAAFFELISKADKLNVACFGDMMDELQLPITRYCRNLTHIARDSHICCSINFSFTIVVHSVRMEPNPFTVDYIWSYLVENHTSPIGILRESPVVTTPTGTTPTGLHGECPEASHILSTISSIPNQTELFVRRYGDATFISKSCCFVKSDCSHLKIRFFENPEVEVGNLVCELSIIERCSWFCCVENTEYYVSSRMLRSHRNELLKKGSPEMLTTEYIMTNMLSFNVCEYYRDQWSNIILQSILIAAGNYGTLCQFQIQIFIVMHRKVKMSGGVCKEDILSAMESSWHELVGDPDEPAPGENIWATVHFEPTGRSLWKGSKTTFYCKIY